MVMDNDPIPTVSVANLNPLVVEREGMITIPVTLTNPTTETVMIDWSTNVGTASANELRCTNKSNTCNFRWS